MPQSTVEIELVPQHRILERFVEGNIDVLVIKLVPQERIPEHTVEETIDVSVSQVMEHMTKFAKFICQKRVPVVLPVPQIQQQTVEVANAVPQKRAQQRMPFDMTVEVPEPVHRQSDGHSSRTTEADTHAVHGHDCRHTFIRCNTSWPRFRRCR